MEAKMKATHAMRMSMGGRRRESVLKGSRMQVGSVSRRPSHWNKMIMKRGKNDVENDQKVLLAIINMLREIKKAKGTPHKVLKNCAELYKRGFKRSGVYTIDPDGKGKFKVYCDQKTAGGGWTVFQRRKDGSVDFYRGWNDYKNGFGDLKGEFWLGLNKIHRLTNQRRNRLRVDLEDTKGKTAYAEYSSFAVTSERSKYKLSLGSYSGTAGDSLSNHRGMAFTTKDRDNDKWSGGSCAVKYKGAWWYESCHSSNLNGLYHHAHYHTVSMRFHNKVMVRPLFKALSSHAAYNHECELVQVYCDQKTAGGGWTVFQKRQDGSVDFYRGWNDYKNGFGNLNGEFWLGLDKIHRLTKERKRLRVDLEDTKGKTAYAEYSSFAVTSERTKYKLSLGSYSGTAGDSLSGHRSMAFTTKDRDNDKWSNNCAVKYKGAWWYKACHDSNLNGLYHHGKHNSDGDGVNWRNWKGHYYSAKRAEMKIRPV
ncbi:Techylectin-5B [Exaiptasia diaphana]|nr:Techylectin-5B [Exaiptasia diaphana]